MLFVYGLEFSGGSAAESATYVEILRTIEKSFNLNPISLLPVFVVIGLIAWKKPTIPTFVAGIAVAAFLGMFLQDVSLKNITCTAALASTRILLLSTRC